ncbi:MAG: hypothetical protein Ta2A_15320 [Treponemataceae bacterium]|nr:MAG: hypothetical protein Ta2A_15320 [Treponemataceae bacterium]
MQKQSRKKTRISYCVLCRAAAAVFAVLLLPACSGFLDGNAFASHVQRYTVKIAAQKIVPEYAITPNSKGVFMVPSAIKTNTVAFQVILNNYGGVKLDVKMKKDYPGVVVAIEDNYSVLTATLPPISKSTAYDMEIELTAAELLRPIKPIVLPKIIRKAASDFYVDSVAGSDEDNYLGTMEKPFKTLAYALEYAESESNSTLYLEDGSGDTQRYAGGIVIDGDKYPLITISTYDNDGDKGVAKIVPSPGNPAKSIIEVKNGGRLTIGSSAKTNIMLTGATGAAALSIHSEASKSGIVDLYGSIEGNNLSGTSTSAVHVGNKGEFLCYGIIKNNEAKKGGAVYLAGGTVTIGSGSSSAAINDNFASSDGGAFYVNGGTVVAKNCTIAGNAANTGDGGAVYIATGKFEIREAAGGVVTIGESSNPNEAISGNGGSVYIGPTPSAVFLATGGTVKDSSAAVHGDDVYVSAGRTLHVSGTVKIGDVYLNNAGGNRGIISVVGLMDNTATGMKIGIDTSNQTNFSDSAFFVEVQDDSYATGAWTNNFLRPGGQSFSYTFLGGKKVLFRDK